MGIDVTWTILFGVLTILVASALETTEEKDILRINYLYLQDIGQQQL